MKAIHVLFKNENDLCEGGKKMEEMQFTLKELRGKEK